MNYLFCCCFGSSQVAPSSPNKKYENLAISMTGPLAKLNLNCHKHLFAFQGCTSILSLVCRYWNRIRKNAINDREYQFLYYKYLSQTKPLLRTIFNITSDLYSFSTFTHKLTLDFTNHVNQDIGISLYEKKLLARISNAKREMKINHSGKISINTHNTYIERINICFELLIKDLPLTDLSWEENLEKLNFPQRCILLLDKIQKLNRVTVVNELIEQLNISPDISNCHLTSSTYIDNYETTLSNINNIFFKPLNSLISYKNSSSESNSTDLKVEESVTETSKEVNDIFERRILDCRKGFSLIRKVVEFPLDILNYYLNLEEIDLNNHWLIIFPDLSILKNLKQIFLRNNLIAEIPREIVASLPKTIRRLDLRNNLIKNVPNELISKPSLTLLDLSDNLFESSEKIGEFTELFINTHRGIRGAIFKINIRIYS